MVKRVGIPVEMKDHERRVVLDPSGAGLIVRAGHELVVQAGAGRGAGFSDEAYVAVGAQIVDDASKVWEADVVVKVKEPQPSEYRFFREGLTLFAFLHLAADPGLVEALSRARVEAWAFETLEDRGALPLLTPMSEIAGRASAIIAAQCLGSPAGGGGILVGGAAGVPPARAVVVGLGIAGASAARGLRGLDAHVTGVDIDLLRLYGRLRDGTVSATLVSSPDALMESVAEADVVVGAALITGARAPVIVTDEMVRAMRPGAVIIDIAIDQGGCVATSRPTTLSEPTYVEHGVLHYCVTNIPGQYPRTASRALAAAVAPRLLRLLQRPDDPGLVGASNVSQGRIVHPAVAAAVSA
ncbi:MAG: alanine dehydrogenase [Actinobacteria bacterium]|nr:alanine dehydrogenase [Actinomycetota bacterium]